jgi:hypothetical protein
VLRIRRAKGLACSSGSAVRQQAQRCGAVLLFDLLLQWAPNEREHNRILVDNPPPLYGFQKNLMGAPVALRERPVLAIFCRS